MKKISVILLAIVVCTLFAVAAFAAQEIPEERQQELLVDDGNLLTDAEESALLARLNSISESQKCDVAVVTVDSLGYKSSQAYADDFYDYNGYGYGADDDGILLLVCMEQRDWALTTYGFAIDAFTDAGQKYIMDEVKFYLSDDLFNQAFNEFAYRCDSFLTQARTGDAYDSGNLPKGSMKNPALHIIAGIAIGAVIALIILFIMKSSLKTVKMQARADSYVRNGSLNVRGSREIFLYQNVARVSRAQSSGGGSSTHSGSSGRSHGGSSGKF